MIPKFNQTMLPILQAIADGNMYSISDIVDRLMGVFAVTPEERESRISNGTSEFSNKVGWGKSYLKQAGLITYPKRGLTQITEEGKNVLRLGLTEITVDFLRQYESFQSFIAPKKRAMLETEPQIVEELTPEDLIEQGFYAFQSSLSRDLLDRLFRVDPYYFEEIILKLFQKMGYGDFMKTRKSGDGGIDGIINQDILGIDQIYTQAKRYTIGKVQAKEIQDFIGAIASSGNVKKGIFVTTTDFSDSAREKVRLTPLYQIILINGDRLVELMIRYNIGVQQKMLYEIKKIDEDFFMNE